MNTDLRKKAKNDIENFFLKLINNAVFGKTIENVRKHRDIKLFTADSTRNYLVSESNSHSTTFFIEYLLAIEMKKMQILMNKPFYLELSMVELSKILMYEFWFNYVKQKNDEKENYVI